MAGFGGATHVIGIHAGTQGQFTDADVAFGLAKLDELGVRIVNLSLGSTAPSSPMLVDAIHKAASDGVLIVAAAGNEASGHVSWPAADLQPSGGGRSYGLAVGATNADGSIASFSSTGQNLSLTAPGNFAGACNGVLVALPKTNGLVDSCYPQWAGQGGATYGYVAGTSFSSPEVAGIAALVWSVRPELTNYQVADIIKQSATRNSAGSWTPSMGCGNVDAAAAVQLALSRSAAEWALSSAAGEQPCSVDGSDPAQWPREVNQTIAFDTIPDRTIADPDFRLDAKASSGLPVEYEAHDNCTVRGNVVHMTGIGLCVITASQSGSVDFNPATPVMQALVISDAVTAIPLPARGRLGGLVTLRYRFNAIGFVTTTIVVQRNGKTIARFGRPYAEVEGGYLHKLAWRTTHAGTRGKLRFCVTARDRLQTRVVPSCAPIELRPAASSAAADRGDDVHVRAVLDRRVEGRSLAIHVDVDVPSQRRAFLAEPVAQAGPAAVELVDRLVHGRRVDLDVPRQVGEQGRERRRQVQVGHGYWMTATSTDEIGGR